MSENFVDRNALLNDIRVKFPGLETQIIKDAIVKFNYNRERILSFLSNLSQNSDLSPNGVLESRNNRASSSSVYSFRSAASDEYNRNYHNSEDLNKIISQKSDLKNMETSFKKLEEELLFCQFQHKSLLQIKEKRFSVPDFPNVSVIEDLEIQLNQFGKIGPRSISYANDLRQPCEMAHKYRGFNNESQHHYHNMSQRPQFQIDDVIYPSNLNPNVFYSPTNINSKLQPFIEMKRNSSHFPAGIDLPPDHPNRPSSSQYPQHPLQRQQQYQHHQQSGHRRNNSYDNNWVNLSNLSHNQHVPRQQPPLPPSQPPAYNNWVSMDDNRYCSVCNNIMNNPTRCSYCGRVYS